MRNSISMPKTPKRTVDRQEYLDHLLEQRAAPPPPGVDPEDTERDWAKRCVCCETCGNSSRRVTLRRPDGGAKREYSGGGLPTPGWARGAIRAGRRRQIRGNR